MTNKLNRLILIAAALLLGALKPANAWIFQEVPDKAVVVHSSVTVAAAVTSTNSILVDLSDTVNYPHKETGELNLDSIRVDIDKIAASTCTVKIGVVNYVDTSTGSVTWVW